MKISDKSTIGDLRKGTQASPSKSGGTGLFSLFSSELQSKHYEADHYNQNLAELRTSLDEAGQSLEQEPTIQNFKKFRELLSKLAKQVSNEAYRLEKVVELP